MPSAAQNAAPDSGRLGQRCNGIGRNRTPERSQEDAEHRPPAGGSQVPRRNLPTFAPYFLVAGHLPGEDPVLGVVFAAQSFWAALGNHGHPLTERAVCLGMQPRAFRKALRALQALGHLEGDLPTPFGTAERRRASWQRYDAADLRPNRTTRWRRRRVLACAKIEPNPKVRRIARRTGCSRNTSRYVLGRLRVLRDPLIEESSREESTSPHRGTDLGVSPYFDDRRDEPDRTAPPASTGIPVNTAEAFDSGAQVGELTRYGHPTRSEVLRRRQAFRELPSFPELRALLARAQHQSQSPEPVREETFKTLALISDSAALGVDAPIPDRVWAADALLRAGGVGTGEPRFKRFRINLALTIAHLPVPLTGLLDLVGRLARRVGLRRLGAVLAAQEIPRWIDACGDREEAKRRVRQQYLNDAEWAKIARWNEALARGLRQEDTMARKQEPTDIDELVALLRADTKRERPEWQMLTDFLDKHSVESMAVRCGLSPEELGLKIQAAWRASKSPLRT